MDLVCNNKWSLSSEDQQQYILALTENLTALRAKAGISQSELASIIGVSRQTYAPIETGKRKMSWTVYLALILFFDYFHTTHQMIRDLRVFPSAFVEQFNNDMPFGLVSDEIFSDQLSAKKLAEMFQKLDTQGMVKINSVLNTEFDRCIGKPGNSKRRSKKAVLPEQ